MYFNYLFKVKNDTCDSYMCTALSHDILIIYPTRDLEWVFLCIMLKVTIYSILESIFSIPTVAINKTLLYINELFG